MSGVLYGKIPIWRRQTLHHPGPRRRSTVQHLEPSFILIRIGWCQSGQLSGLPREECVISGSHRAGFLWRLQVRKDRTPAAHSAGAWPLHSWLTSFSSCCPWAAADTSLRIPFVAVVWHSARTPLPKKFPLGLFPESNGLTISTTEFTHRDRRRQLFLDGQSKLAWMTRSCAVIIRSGVWDTKEHKCSR